MSEQLKKSSTLGGIDVGHNCRVKIPFKGINAQLNNWNECCAIAIEKFGLPGDKYSCTFTEEYIEFWFLEEKDAMLFELTCG